jgi:heme-degrading monooxygenase HmoA
MRASFHLAQVNVARARGEMTDPVMAEFVARLPEINALADQSPGFVWRLQTEDGDATAVRPYEDARILINLSVWTDLRALRAYVYGSAHAAVMRRRREWFERFDRRSSPRPSGATRTYCVRLQLRRAVRARRPSDAT